ncbi:hypothetical protein B484DRAFT_459439 [Ochromonadaceae sp. CCMP2298]|nr:hypothetical protein B484DRAFT_459439 [Ochromonadaceae sp. CCMP2298]
MPPATPRSPSRYHPGWDRSAARRRRQFLSLSPPAGPRWSACAPRTRTPPLEC